MVRFMLISNFFRIVLMKNRVSMYLLSYTQKFEYCTNSHVKKAV
jgi:hypothetical protein